MILRAAILWLSILAVLILFHGTLATFGGAILLAFVISPLVNRISRIRIGSRTVPRWAGILSVYLFFALALWGFSVSVLPQLYREGVRLSAEARSFLNELTPERIAAYTDAAEAWLDSHGIPLVFGDDPVLPEASADQTPDAPKLHFNLDGALRDTVTESTLWLKGHLLELVGFSQRLIGAILGGIFSIFFMLMVSAFLLIDVEGVQGFFRSMVPFGWRPGFDDLLVRVDQKLSGAVRGQIVICLVNGVLTLIGLLILQVKFAMILAIIATVLSFIPIFGTVISTIPIVLVGLTQGFGTAMGALAWILGIHAVEAYALNPKILGESAHIHPVVIAFALLAGEQTFGFVGALLAVPVTSVLLAIFGFFKDRADHLQRIELGFESASSAAAELPAATASGPLSGEPG